MSQTIWSQPDLARLAEHNKPEVRRWACERMRILYGEAGIEILERLLRDKDKDVLVEALEYLENYPDPKHGNALLNLYETQEGAVAGKSAFLLGKGKDERLISTYKKKIHSRTVGPNETVWVIRALGELGTPEAKVILREMLSKAKGGADSFSIHALIYALVQAKEDLGYILKYYSQLYKDFAMEVLHPLTMVCESWFSMEDLKEKGKRRVYKNGMPRVVSETLDYLKDRGLSSLEKELRRSFKKMDYPRMIEAAWNHAEGTISQKKPVMGGEFILEGDFPPERNYQILKGFREYLSWGPEDSLKGIAIATLAILATCVEFENLFNLKVEELQEEALFQVLFEDRGSLDIDRQIMDRLFNTAPAQMIFDRSVKQLEKAPYSFGTERALKILARLKEKKAIPLLVSYLGKEASHAALENCIDALVQIGSPVIEYLAKDYDRLNEDQQFEIPYVLKDIPKEETADLLLRNWDRLWGTDKESFLYALEGVASKRFIDPLRKELKEGEAMEEEVFYLLCHIHGVNDILLPKIEAGMMAREKEVERRSSMLERDELGPLMERAVKLELKCRGCGKSYYYDVENILMPSSEKDEPRIMDKIVCKNCRAINQYEITTKGELAITSQMILMTALAEKGKAIPEDSPIKFAESGLMDGRRMSFDEILEYYKGEIRKSPNDPAMRIGYGNVLMKAGNETEAILHYQEALRLDPLAIEAYCNLGEYEGNKGNLARAYEYFKKAYDYLHTGHYYRVKEPDQLKEAIVVNLAHFEELLGKGEKGISELPFQGIIKKDKVGRNDPCPCGSGKKYKKCCLNRDELKEPVKTSATPKEIEMRDRLISFSGKEKYKKEFEKAYSLFWRRSFSQPLVLDEKDERDFPLFLEWFIHDFSLWNGMTIVEEFYHEKKEKLSEEEISLLKHEIASYLSLYEVTSVNPGVGLRLKDLFTGEEMDVLEVRGSLAAVKWDMFFARVIRMGDVNKLSGVVSLIPRRMKENVLSSVNEVWKRFKSETGNHGWPYFVKSNAHIIHHLIEDQPLKEPVFVTEEYHRICSSKAVFDVDNFNAVRYRLAHEFDFIIDEEKEGKKILFTWLKRGPSKHWEMQEPPEGSVMFRSEMIRGKGELRWTSLGTVTLTPRRLELWCLSKERLNQGKKRLFEILGDNIQHRIDTYEDVVKKAMQSSGESPFGAEDEIPEKFFPVFEKTMEEWVTKWVDEKIPALDGKTPREAVQTPEGREKVEELLKDWENAEERRRKKGEPYIDINTLRQMLNL